MDIRAAEISSIIKEQIAIPRKLQTAMKKEKNSITIPAHYSYLKDFLIDT